MARLLLVLIVVAFIAFAVWAVKYHDLPADVRVLPRRERRAELQRRAAANRRAAEDAEIDRALRWDPTITREDPRP